MSAIKDGRLPITLDRERHMLFSLNVLDEMQDKFGGYDMLSEVLRGKESIKNVKWLLTRLVNEGADDGDEPVTEQWIGKQIHAGNLQEVIALIMQSFTFGATGGEEVSDSEDASPNAESGTE